MFLTKCMGAFMFVEEVPHVNAHAKTFKPRVIELEDLLLRITVCVIDEVLRFLGIWNREYPLYKELSDKEISGHNIGRTG